MSVGRKISAVDLFCGAGGLTYGLEMAGIEVRLGVDIDPACEHPIHSNTNSKFMLEDVNKLSGNFLKSQFRENSISLLAGCAPCQPFSTYARKAQQRSMSRPSVEDQSDWKLVERFGALVREVKPDLVTMENVPPLLRQTVFEQFLDELSGYYMDYRVVECETIGLPQSRKRLVVLASKFGPITIPEFDYDRKTVREAIACLPEISAGGGDAADKLHRSSKLSAMNLERIKNSVPGGTWRDWPSELRANCHDKESGATYPSVYGRMEWDGLSPTITTQCFGYGNGRFGHPEQNRAISLREAAMLQGFPRDYSFIPEGELVSFAKLGRLIGNAVPVTLSHAIGTVLVEHINAL